MALQMTTTKKERESMGYRRPFQPGGGWGMLEFSILLGVVLLIVASICLAQKYDQVWRIWEGQVSEDSVNGYDAQAAWRDNVVKITRLDSAVKVGAVCLDGSPPAYYLDPGSGKGADNWLIHFEGGGWCPTAEDCLNRAFSQLGSSRYMPDEIHMGGILSSNPTTNPDFYNWNRVRLKYCDGGSYFGDVEEGVTMKQSLKTKYSETSTTVYYRGMRIWKAFIDDLLSKGMANAKKGFLTGCSAGGLASFLHCDSFKELMPENAYVKCMSDAGFFLHMPDIKGATTIESFYKDVVTLQNITGSLPKECTSARDPAHVSKQIPMLIHEGDWQTVLHARCFFPSYLLPLIKTPFFVLNPAYDNWQFYNVLIPTTADPNNDWERCKINFSFCNQSQMTTVQDFRTELLNQLGSVLQNRRGGAFIDSCYTHCQLELDVSWSGNGSPKIHGKSIRQAVGEWYNDNKANVLVDCPFPCNPTCGWS